MVIFFMLIIKPTMSDSESDCEYFDAKENVDECDKQEKIAIENSDQNRSNAKQVFGEKQLIKMYQELEIENTVVEKMENPVYLKTRETVLKPNQELEKDSSYYTSQEDSKINQELEKMMLKYNKPNTYNLEYYVPNLDEILTHRQKFLNSVTIPNREDNSMLLDESGKVLNRFNSGVQTCEELLNNLDKHMST